MADDPHHNHNPWVSTSILAASGVAAALTLAPTVLPHLGIGDPFLGEDAMNLMHVHEASVAGGAAASSNIMATEGLAQMINGGLGHIPLVGNALVTNSFVSIGATAVIGIGGVLLANWLEKREAPHATIKWSSIIRTAALVTSALIALPAILTGISVGITYLGLLFGGTSVGGAVAGFMSTTLGAAAGHSGAVSLLGATLPHLFLCGAAILPVALAVFMGKKQSPKHTAPEEPSAHITLASATPTQAGQPCKLAFRVVDSRSGRALAPEDIATTYTHKIHTMIVDQSLNDYHHLHPTYDAKTGLFTCEFTPTMNNRYNVWNDFQRAGETDRTQLKTALPSQSRQSIPARILPSNAVEMDGLRLQLSCKPPLRAGQCSTITTEIRDVATGALVPDLAPIMGAYAHLAGFSQSGAHFMHCHPLGDMPASDAARSPGRLMFHVTPQSAEPAKFFLQINRAGREMTLPFGQLVQQPAQFSTRPAAPATHAGHALA